MMKIVCKREYAIKEYFFSTQRCQCHIDISVRGEAKKNIENECVQTNSNCLKICQKSSNSLQVLFFTYFVMKYKQSFCMNLNLFEIIYNEFLNDYFSSA